MFDDIFNNDWNNQKDDENNNIFRKFYFNWYSDPSKMFKGSLEDSRNLGKWIFGHKKKTRIENVCVATLTEDEQAWYKELVSRQQDLTKRINHLQRQIERAQYEQSIIDIDISEFNVNIRDTHNLSVDKYPELIVGSDSKHIYQQVDLSSQNSNESEE